MKQLKMLIVMVVLLLSACIHDQLSQQERVPKMEETEKQEQVPIRESKEKVETTKDVKPFELPTYHKVKNFLLIGVDSRGEPSSRSDAIMVARYNPRDQSVKLVSLMRDSYVEIPGGELQFSKLNHAYFIGGEQLLKETIEENFQIPIDYTAVIDFQGFVKVVDLIAPEGIEVELTQEMIDDRGFSGGPGKRKLHGDELLSYVRFRHDAMSDFGRVNRQQEVLVSLKNQAQEELGSMRGIIKLPGILKEMMVHMDTDLNWDDYFAIGATFLAKPVKQVDTLRIPVANSFENRHYEHVGAVLELDFNENQQALDEFFQSQPNNQN
ncbi:LCP family protein [Cytobacillus spongiae]|uniref:LCP family protein n=1 Tax=Cytobacillus spongiae TaxID=2901381 RepID=UPI001F39E6FD|nr:LCP family protein [Cytobacillus spongiae]UII57930.1 LCP family protein [Cytobacillus spongiae]